MARISSTLLLALSLAIGSDAAAECKPRLLAVSDSDWAALNASTSGRLYNGRPAALPCFTSYQNITNQFENGANAAQCKAVDDGIATSAELIKTFGSYHNPTFATCMTRNQKCAVSTSHEGIINGTCFQGTVPDYYVDAREVKDIEATLEFANAHQIPITVKNTGHDYKGRSTGPNTLAIWTHNLSPKPIINENFTPDACVAPVGPVLTYGAGQTGTDLYNFLEGTGYLAVGGSCQTVGVSGGWLAGGGHGIISPTFGLGVDNAIQIKAVLPNGTYVTANRCQNPDLFFALRGGGGNTFGVVTETTAKLHKDTPFSYAFLTMPLQEDPRKMNEILVANAVRWADEGWGGLYGVDGIKVGSNGIFLGFNPNLNTQQAQVSLKPITDYFDSMTTATAKPTVNITSLPNQKAAQNAPELVGFLNTEAGVSLTRSSRLVPRSNFQDPAGQKAVVDVLMTAGWAAVLSAPTAFKLPASDLPGGPGESSITPAWREALWHFTYTAAWDPADANATTPDALTKIFTDISKQMDPMRAITPTAGAYQNEGDVYEPDPVNSFWGKANYDRLLKIKQTLDPNNVMSCFNCIGWVKDDPRFKCYLKVREDEVGSA